MYLPDSGSGELLYDFPKHWPEEVRNIFRRHYNKSGPKKVYQRLKEIGHPMPLSTIKGYSNRYGNFAFDVTDGFTVREAARMLNVKYTTLWTYVKRNYSDRIQKRAHLIVMSFDVFDELEKRYQEVPEGYITLTKAAKKIGYCPSTLRGAIERGKLQGVKHGRTIYIHSDLIGRISKYIKDTGRVNIRWDELNSKVKPPPIGYIGVVRACEILEKDEAYIYAHVREGRLSSYKYCGNVYVKSSEILRIAKHFKINNTTSFYWEHVDFSTPECPPPEGYIPQDEALSILGKPIEYVWRHLKDGRISSHRYYGNLYLKKEEMEIIGNHFKTDKTVQFNWERVDFSIPECPPPEGYFPKQKALAILKKTDSYIRKNIRDGRISSYMYYGCTYLKKKEIMFISKYLKENNLKVFPWSKIDVKKAVS